MTHPTNPLTLLIASAGSGKTQRIAQESLNSLRNCHPILAVTFTRKAAAELRTRILKLATQPDQPQDLIKNLLFNASLLETGTIDSLILRIYQHIAPFLFLPTYQELLVDEAALLQAQHHLLRNLWKKLSQKSHYQSLQEAFSQSPPDKGLNLTRTFRNALQTLIQESPIRTRILKNLLIAPPSGQSLKIQKILDNAALAATKFLPEFITSRLYAVLEEVLHLYRQENRTLFLSDLQYVVELTALNVPPFIVLPYRHIKHLLLDEAQDTSLLQWTVLEPLMEELRGQGYPVHIVGDPKQSIYAWREADLDYFLALRRKAHQDFLSQNYRSHKRIVLFNNRFYSRLMRYLGNLAAHSSPKQDSHKIAATAHLAAVYSHHKQKWGHLIGSGRSGSNQRGPGFYPMVRVRGYEEEASLARSLRRRLCALRAAGIPPRETAFLVRSNQDIARLRRFLPEYDLQITSHPLGKVASLYAIMELLMISQSRPADLQALPPPASRQFLEYQGLYEDFAKAFLGATLPDTAMDWWRTFHTLLQSIHTHLPAETLFWQAFLDHLWGFLQGHIAPSLADILNWWEEKGSQILVEVPLGSDTYPVLTIHKAKGLAWDVVIIPFANWSLFYHSARPKWFTVEDISSSMELSAADEKTLGRIGDALTELPPSSPVAYTLQLPLYVGSEDKSLKPLYAEAWKTAVLENLNLHYVATTRPRRALFIFYQKRNGRKGSFPAKWDELYRRFQR